MSNESAAKVFWRNPRLKTMAPFLVLAGMILIFIILRPAYLSTVNIRSILIQTSFLGIISIGATLVMMTGGVEMSNGYVAGLGALMGMWYVVRNDMPMWLGILLALGVVAMIGSINGLCVSRLGVAPFVSTLGTMYLAMGLQNWINEGGQQISYGMPKAYIFLGQGSIGFMPMPVVIFILVFVIFYVITELTPVGRYLKGSGLNQFASRLSGVRVSAYVFLSYVLSAVLAGLLGYILGASQKYIASSLGSGYQMDSLLTILLGKTLMDGKISVKATAFGALFLCAFENGLSMIGMPVTTLAICKGVLLIVILLFSRFRRKQ